ncbi:MAG TPA: hypothetical protein VJH88_04485 [Candidatus Nanoarchaeia archaeon]|nr:hypothetical protein [Candidatus Nanoarchaeia archaeon]
MRATENSCVVCEEVITNPICPDCLARQMRAWLSEVKPALAGTIDGGYVPGETNCLFCSKDMGICAHCYSRDVYEQLMLSDEKIAKEFMARFDFELRKEVVVL